MSSGHDDNRIFRKEALEHQFRDSGSQGVLKASPVWSWSVLLVSSMLVIAAGLFLIFAEVELPGRVEGVITVAGGTDGRGAMATVWLSENETRQIGSARTVNVAWHDLARNQVVAGAGEILRLEPVRSASGETRYRLQFRILESAASESSDLTFVEGTRVTVLLAAQKQRLLWLMTGAGGASGQ